MGQDWEKRTVKVSTTPTLRRPGKSKKLNLEPNRPQLYQVPKSTALWQVGNLRSEACSLQLGSKIFNLRSSRLITHKSIRDSCNSNEVNCNNKAIDFTQLTGVKITSRKPIAIYNRLS
jgi:hypothetical protein